MMHSIQIKSLKCFLFKKLNIFFFYLNLVSYFNNVINNVTAFGLNKKLYDMFSPLPFERLLCKIKMNKSLPSDCGVYTFNHKIFASAGTSMVEDSNRHGGLS